MEQQHFHRWFKGTAVSCRLRQCELGLVVLLVSICNNTNLTTFHTRDATIYQYIVYRIILSLYQCINTKSNRIDILHIVMIYQHIMACFNEIIVHWDQPKWYMMLHKGKKNVIYFS